MNTTLLVYVGITATLAVLLLLMVVQAAAPARPRRDVGARAGAALGGVESSVRQPHVAGA